MTSTELRNILAELYRLEPELKEHEAGLCQLIAQMSDLKPDTKFDPAFAARLKIQLQSKTPANAHGTVEPIARPQDQTNKSESFNINLMNKKIYFAVGSVAVMAVVIILATTVLRPGLKTPGGSIETISQLPAGAFGSLALLNNNANNAGGEGNNLAAGAPAPLGLGGDAESGAFAARSQSGGGGTASTISSDLAVESKMIAPYFSYKYKYTGAPLELIENASSVYRRLKGDGESGRALANLVRGLNLSELDLSTFSNLRATNLSLIEDKDKGLMVNFDFNEDNIYISENWEKWRIMERESCNGDQACWDRFRLQLSDVPADNELIALADRFLSDHKVSRERYGEPQVDNAWREVYAQMPDKNNFYIPEYSTVIYPLLLDGEPVRDQSGSYTGLRVTINLLKKAASGLSGLAPYRYQSSSYELETSAESIIRVAESGGWNHGWFGGNEDTRTLELGTPERVYVQLWHYTGGRNDELLVPSLIFPILNPPSDMYYGPRTVIVPLVKEMLDELNKQPQIMPLPIDGGGGDQPIIMSETAPSTEPAPSILR